MKRLAALMILFFCLGFAAMTQQALPVADDPVLEARVSKLSQELRCLVCQNETLADSRAGLAEDLRKQIREQMKAGKSDKEIIAFLTARYGDFVLYRPPVRPSTYLLWFGPFALLVIGLVLLFRYLKQRRQLIHDQPLSKEERRQVEALLKSPPGKEIA